MHGLTYGCPRSCCPKCTCMTWLMGVLDLAGPKLQMCVHACPKVTDVHATCMSDVCTYMHVLKLEMFILHTCPMHMHVLNVHACPKCTCMSYSYRCTCVSHVRKLEDANFSSTDTSWHRYKFHVSWLLSVLNTPTHVLNSLWVPPPPIPVHEDEEGGDNAALGQGVGQQVRTLQQTHAAVHHRS